MEETTRDFYAELRMFGLTSDQASDLSTIIEEYGKQQWNAALDEAIKNSNVIYTQYGNTTLAEINKEPILKLKK